MPSPQRAEPVSVPLPDGRLLMDGFARWILSPIEPLSDRVPYVRRQAQAVLRLWDVNEDLTWPIELILTELASNVVRNARTPFTVMLAWDGETVRGEVSDANPQSPRPQDIVLPDSPGGRGLILVQDLATTWGTQVRHHGKTVWFTVRS
jgi:anti-sigma regulatory factor (Ser/Thr protein kinase)